MAQKMTRASEGYFLAKRQLQDTLARRIMDLEKKAHVAEVRGNFAESLDLQCLAIELTKVRDYVRNVMLWDTKKGD